MDLIELWAYCGKEFDFEKTVEQYEINTTKSLNDYKEKMKNHKPNEEELYEMQAAFGKGTTVVDVITGKKIKVKIIRKK